MVEQHAELARLLDDIPYGGWSVESRCPGWSIADVVLHLAQTDEMAVASLDETFDEFAAAWIDDAQGATTIDDLAGLAVERERGAAPQEIHERWLAATGALAERYARSDLPQRVPWVAGTLAPRTLAVTRLSECWVHTNDIADAAGVDLEPTERLRHVARLSWRTLPYAFTRAGRELSGPVAFELVGPAGEVWEFQPDEPALTTIRGSGVELCEVATQRRDASGTSLTGEGPDADAVLALVRSFA